MRAFIAIELPEEAKELVKEIQKGLEIQGKLTNTENLHLTLKFLGEINQITLERVKEKLKTIKFIPFEAKLSKTGSFGERIVWIKFEGADSLQKDIDDSLKDIFPKEERFMGHITIARTEKITYIPENHKEVSFVVKEFLLKRSNLTPKGPIYENIDVYTTNK